jgi:hypothetical protein
MRVVSCSFISFVCLGLMLVLFLLDIKNYCLEGNFGCEMRIFMKSFCSKFFILHEIISNVCQEWLNLFCIDILGYS